MAAKTMSGISPPTGLDPRVARSHSTGGGVAPVANRGVVVRDCWVEESVSGPIGP